MRLNDADKYCDFLNKYPLEKAQSNVMTFYRDALQHTFECEVEAIPIEWINKWLEVCTEDEAQTIAVMVYAWNLEEGQKENEVN